MLESPYPLQGITDADLQRLTEALWDWYICEACQSGAECIMARCAWKRSARLGRFFDFYKDITTSYVPDLLPCSEPALRRHEDIIGTILLLREKPSSKRSELTHECFSRRDAKPPSLADQHRAVNLIVQVMAMVKCSAENQPLGVLELGTQPLLWRTDKSLAEFMSSASPQSDNVNLCVHDDLNGRRGVVEIYHYTSVLKEHLVASRPDDGTATFEQSISKGNIPRQVALEALDSVQKILFPFDSDSECFLRELVSKQSFDPDCLRYDSTGYRMQAEQEICYKYFSRRLMDLFEELENPNPRGILEKWFQRKSGARYMMMATLVGVLFAVILARRLNIVYLQFGFPKEGP
ncbi:hypothetical protein HRG_000265 [Hirsutella rhossiliensis]|uniref:Uncharacterized protein n=1 Tax=Hirsutella rhossiliensis TaxID=111463 RepID=A0A9P8SLL9_9HYPO|nr:uncharacterized protein HRG_00265 [Hirsutella rhossiliensis]KAH0967623.1 hypothetical protein HRG_00265 [Hirsutella rhossiliensis]